MQYGVIYHKDALALFERLRKGDINSDEYILLCSDNQEGWHEMLNNKEIDPNRVEGIDVYQLEAFGAIVPNPVPPFTLEEVFYIMYKTTPIRNEDLKDVLIRIGREPSTPVMLKYIFCRDQFAQKIGKQFPIIKQEK